MSSAEDLDKSLRLAIDLDEAVRKAMTPKAMTVPAVQIGDRAVLAPGLLRLIEDLWLARRTFSAVHFLMDATSRSRTPAADFTESAAVLVRRLVELLAQVAWLTDYPHPTGVHLPAPLGDPEAMAGLLPTVAEPTRSEMLGYLASVRSWIDVQAMRAQRRDIREQRKSVTDLATDDIQRRDAELVMLKAFDAAIVARLDAIGVESSERFDYVTILRRMGPAYVTLYRYETDVSHAGGIGRAHQRGGEDEPMLGAPATAARRGMVLDTAISAILEIAHRVLGELGVDTDPVDQLAEAHRVRLTATQ